MHRITFPGDLSPLSRTSRDKHLFRTVAKPVMYITIIGLLGKALSLIRDASIASVFGLAGVSDVYFYASTLLVLVATIIVQSINTTVIPALIREKLRVGDAGKQQLMNNITSCVMIISLFVTLSLIIVTFYQPAIDFLAPGFDQDQRETFALMTRLGAASIISLSILAVNRSYLQSEGRYVETAVSDLILAVVGIVFILFLADTFGLYALILAMLVAPMLQFVVQYVGLARLGFKFKPYLNLRDNELKVIGSLIIPVIISTGIGDVSKLVDQALASTLTDGGLSALAFGGKINGIVVGICIVPLVTVVFPLLSLSASSGDYDKLKRELQRVVIFVFMITFPATLAVLALSENIVTIIFERGQFDSGSTLITSEVLFFYSLGLVAAGLRLVLIKVFYSLQDTRSPVIYAIIASLLNITLNFVLIGPLEHMGLALATTLSSFAFCIMLWISLNRRIKNILSSDMVGPTLRIFAAASLMFFWVIFLKKFVIYSGQSPMDQTLAIGLLGLSGIAIYTVSLLVLKVKEASWIILLIRK